MLRSALLLTPLEVNLFHSGSAWSPGDRQYTAGEGRVLGLVVAKTTFATLSAVKVAFVAPSRTGTATAYSRSCGPSRLRPEVAGNHLSWGIWSWIFGQTSSTEAPDPRNLGVGHGGPTVEIIFMSASEAESAYPDRVECDLDNQYAYFYLSENTALINPGVSTWGGMVTASAGKLKLQVPWRADRVSLTVETHERKPADALDGYDDVIEFDYWSATGLAAILDWTQSLACALNPLPIGPGDYRIRYHVTEKEYADSDPGPHRNARTLIQIWPGRLGVEQELKITGRLGNFWHPGKKLRSALELREGS